MNKVKVGVVGVAKDASFTNNNTGDQVQCYEIPCSGTVDGIQCEFVAKIFGKGGDKKIINGLEYNGERSEYQGTVFYTLKKANNPDMYKSSQGYGGGGGGGGRTFTPQHELNALRVAADVVTSHMKHNSELTDSTVDEVADKIVKLARDKFVPFLRATTERHDDVAKRDETKKLQAQTIRQLIATNDLTSRVQAAGATTGSLASMYEESGSDAVAFVNAIRQKFAEAVPPQAEEEDDIPF